MKNNLIISNFAYILVGILGYAFIGNIAIISILLGLCSIYYHYDERNTTDLLCDQIFARIVMLVNVYLLILSLNFVSITGTFFAFISTYRYAKKENREWNHTIRHIMSAIATGIIYYGYYLTLIN